MNLGNLQVCQLGVVMLLSTGACSMISLIFHILFLCSPSEITKTTIEWILIRKVTTYAVFRARPNECHQYKIMDIKFECLAIFAK